MRFDPFFPYLGLRSSALHAWKAGETSRVEQAAMLLAALKAGTELACVLNK